MVKKETNSTEDRILAAARQVFLEKGMAGGRMQEIADKAGINKAMLHYYFRNKQQLFEAVFKNAFLKMAPKLGRILNEDIPLLEKIRVFCRTYIHFLREQPYLPAFIVQELNRNPEFISTTILQSGLFPSLDLFNKQVDQEIQAGRIRPIDSRQLFIHIVSLSIFPFVGAPLLRFFTGTDKIAFDELVEKRESEVAEFIINAIKIAP